jgi:putative transposase
MRFRLQPTPAQEVVLLEYGSHARFMWHLAVEQHRHWRAGRAGAPGYVEQSRQLAEARKEFVWLAAGSQTVRQQAVRDFAQAMANFFAGTHLRPTWRKAGEVWVPKVGWVRFRWSRHVPGEAKSFRVKRDRADRWHVCFPVIQSPVGGPGTGGALQPSGGAANREPQPVLPSG